MIDDEIKEAIYSIREALDPDLSYSGNIIVDAYEKSQIEIEQLKRIQAEALEQLKGFFDYRYDDRLEKAIELLETGSTMKGGFA